MRFAVGRIPQSRSFEMAAMISIASMCARPTSHVAAPAKPRVAASGFYGNASALSTRVGSGSAAGQRGALVINMAASKAKKSRDLGMLKGMLEKEETLLVAGFNFQGLRVRTRDEINTASRDSATASSEENRMMRRVGLALPRFLVQRPSMSHIFSLSMIPTMYQTRTRGVRSVGSDPNVDTARQCDVARVRLKPRVWGFW